MATLPAGTFARAALLTTVAAACAGLAIATHRASPSPASDEAVGAATGPAPVCDRPEQWTDWPAPDAPAVVAAELDVAGPAPTATIGPASPLLPPVTPQPRHAAFQPGGNRDLGRAWAPLKPAAEQPKLTWMVAALLAAPEVSLQARDDRTRLYPNRDGQDHPVLNLFDRRPDLAGLPVLRGSACELPRDQATQLGERSIELRHQLRNINDKLSRPLIPPDTSSIYAVPKTPPPARWHIAPGRAALAVQIAQCDATPIRRLLIQALGGEVTAATTQALAHRALFELDSDLRAAAVEALRGRPAAEVRPSLVAGLRYPWPPVALHAADALMALSDADAAPDLKELLSGNDPAVPHADGKVSWEVREVVRVNHARNCQLCHAPSWNPDDPVRVTVPSPDQPLPPSFSVHYYSRASNDAIVRADVTYLRPDFSWMLPVDEPGPWPRWQRFDFIVRRRPATADELAAAGGALPSPQRLAARRALDFLSAVPAVLPEKNPPPPRKDRLAPRSGTGAVRTRSG